MYLIKVIPITRKINVDELSYFSSEKIEVGAIIEIPIRKKQDLGIVVFCDVVKNQKNHIKTLNYKLIHLDDIKLKMIISKDVVSCIYDFCEYSLIEVPTLLRIIFGKSKIKNNKLETITITSSTEKNKDTIPFHSFFFLLNKENINNIKKIIVKDPQKLSNYGLSLFNFDPLPLIVKISKALNLELEFVSNYTNLRYSEWDIKYSPLKNENNATKNKLLILNRENENHTLKANPFSKEVLEYIKKNYKTKKILILGGKKNMSTNTICGDCSSFHTCSKCHKNLTLLKNNKNYIQKYKLGGDYIYVCTECSTGEPSLVKCKNCDSWNLVPIGYGTERILNEIKSIIPESSEIYIYDLSANISSKKINAWQENNGILVTRLNYLNEVPKSDVLIILSLGFLLNQEIFEANENTKNIMNNLDKITEKTIINILHKEEEDFINLDYKKWLKEEKKFREDLSYPPYARYLVIKFNVYISQNLKLSSKIIDEVKKLAIPNTVTTKKDINGQITLYASFNKDKWNLDSKGLETPRLLIDKIYLFKKYLEFNVL